MLYLKVQQNEFESRYKIGDMIFVDIFDKKEAINGYIYICR